MRIDLEQALHDVASSVHDDATAERMAGQVRHMVTRVRRRRAARHTANGLVGVGAAAAIAVTTTQILGADGRGYDGQDRAAGTGEEASPSPAEDLFGTCGSTVVVSDADAGLIVETALEPLAGSDVLHASVRAELRADAGAAEYADPVIVLARDGVVVSPVGQVVSVAESAPPAFALEQPLVSCEDGAPLAGGRYQVFVRQEVTAPDGSVVATVHGPVPLTVPDGAGAGRDGSPSSDDDVAAAEARITEILATRELADHFPFCGAVVPPGPADPLLTATVVEPSGGLVVAPGERGEVSLGLRTGGGRHVIANSAPAGTLVFLVDGVAVGYQWLDSEDLTLVDLGPEDQVTLPVRVDASVCGADGAVEGGGLPLPPGEYEAVASLDLLLKEITEADGRARPSSEPWTVVSEPVTVTVR